jgi:hypothetical protein
MDTLKTFISWPFQQFARLTNYCWDRPFIVCEDGEGTALEGWWPKTWRTALWAPVKATGLVLKTVTLGVALTAGLATAFVLAAFIGVVLLLEMADGGIAWLKGRWEDRKSEPSVTVTPEPEVAPAA